MCNRIEIGRITAIRSRAVGIAIACLIATACAQVEFTGPKRYYNVDRIESDNEMNLSELTKTKKDPLHWGTVHFGRKAEDKEDITIDLGKEKNDFRPSRYFARTKLPEINGKSLGFTVSVDSKREAWMGIEFKVKTNFWSPGGAMK